MGKDARNYGDTTIKRLFSLTGNKCANCKSAITLRDGSLIGQICHIEGANEKSARYNPLMTDQQRAAFENLIILCANCHIVTNNVNLFSSNRLQQIKREHELLHQDNNPTEEELDRFLRSVKVYEHDFSEQEDWGILEDIIKYALDHAASENMSSDAIKSSEGFIALSKKVKLNFPAEELIRFGEMYQSTTARGAAIKEYLRKLSELDPIRVDELNESVIFNYCELKKVSLPDTPVGSIKIIEDLATTLIPEVKRNSPQYRSVARALVIQTFEFCSIGEKTERNAQTSLFD